MNPLQCEVVSANVLAKVFDNRNLLIQWKYQKGSQICIFRTLLEMHGFHFKIGS